MIFLYEKIPNQKKDFKTQNGWINIKMKQS